MSILLHHQPPHLQQARLVCCGFTDAATRQLSVSRREAPLSLSELGSALSVCSVNPDVFNALLKRPCVSLSLLEPKSDFTASASALDWALQSVRRQRLKRFLRQPFVMDLMRGPSVTISRL